MIREITMFQVVCDGCGAIPEDLDGVVAWTDVVGARDSAEGDGGFECREKDLCPACWAKEQP